MVARSILVSDVLINTVPEFSSRILANEIAEEKHHGEVLDWGDRRLVLDFAERESIIESELSWKGFVGAIRVGERCEVLEAQVTVGDPVLRTRFPKLKRHRHTSTSERNGCRRR